MEYVEYSIQYRIECKKNIGKKQKEEEEEDMKKEKRAREIKKKKEKNDQIEGRRRLCCVGENTGFGTFSQWLPKLKYLLFVYCHMKLELVWCVDVCLASVVSLTRFGDKFIDVYEE